jgi:hypothetical protein
MFAVLNIIHRCRLNRFDFLFGDKAACVARDGSASAFLASAENH